ncbi:hypothetical protein BLA29_011622 [Euroglyphus maynei]|uniref:Uncharacterized protein n=1 Tax=Euroglyphus maynei TaxID=6958 RepID=A0A1Y3B1R0_EURMA|nr:hypothetical protein BLA29_011622 [Euroglyphus maynei]
MENKNRRLHIDRAKNRKIVEVKIVFFHSIHSKFPFCSVL